jgi:hypothetical protein
MHKMIVYPVSLPSKRGGTVMKRVGLVLVTVLLFVFVSCDKGKKAEEEASNIHSQGSPETVSEKVVDIAQEIEQKAGETIEEAKDVAREAVDAVRQKSQELSKKMADKTDGVVMTVKEKAEGVVHGIHKKSEEADQSLDD